MNIRKFLGKLVCIVSVINIMVLNVKGGVIVNAEEIVDIVDGDNNIELKDAEKIAWYHILNMINWNVNLINNYIIKYFVCIMLSLIFINLYNGKQGRKTDYMFYAKNPLHLLIIYIIGIS